MPFVGGVTWMAVSESLSGSVSFAEDSRCNNRERRVLVGGIRVVTRGGCIVDRVHRDRHHCHVRVARAVIGLVGEAIASVEAGVRHVGEAAVGYERERAVRRRGDLDRSQWVALRVGVVRQHSRCMPP